MLDAMQQLLMGAGPYDPDYLAVLLQCMEDINPTLRIASVRFSLLAVKTHGS